MMAKLINKKTKLVLVEQLNIAQSFLSRLVGLLGHKNLNASEGLWIHKCNSIHTFFMRFTIDCIFLDENLKIKKVFSYVKPWRVTWPVWSARSVIELPAGAAQFLNLREGDELYVEP